MNDGEWKTAKWDHLIELFEQEPLTDLNDSGTRGLSKLTEVAVKPKPIERQKVDTCLRVFCDETICALSSHPSVCANPEVKDTANFIRIVTGMWTILNVRSDFKDIKHNNPLEAVIKTPDDPRLDQLLQLAEMFQKMGRNLRHKRVKQLTVDTAKALHHTLNGLVELCRHLLATSHEYVMLGEFSNDPIERLFGKIRQGSGGTYFVSALSVLEKFDIMKAKLLL